MKVKCIPSDYAIAKWYAYSFKLDFDKMPDDKLAKNNQKLTDKRADGSTTYEIVKKFLAKLETRGIPEKVIAVHANNK